MQNHTSLASIYKFSFVAILLSIVLFCGCGKNTPTVPAKPTPPPLSRRFIPALYNVQKQEVLVNNAWQVKVLDANSCENDQIFGFSTYPTDYLQMTDQCVPAANSPHWAWVIDDATNTLTATDANGNVVMSGPFEVEDDNHYIIFTNTHTTNNAPNERYTMLREYN